MQSYAFLLLSPARRSDASPRRPLSVPRSVRTSTPARQASSAVPAPIWHPAALKKCRPGVAPSTPAMNTARDAVAAAPTAANVTSVPGDRLSDDSRNPDSERKRHRMYLQHHSGRAGASDSDSF
eukprot:365872-Chlamydomonas_euryale.AAC.5